MKIRGKRRGSASVIARQWRRSGSAIEISTSRWSPIINRIVSDPPGSHLRIDISTGLRRPSHANSERIMRGKGANSCRFVPLFPFHFIFLSLFSRRAPSPCRLHEHKEGSFRPVTMSPRECLLHPFIFELILVDINRSNS